MFTERIASARLADLLVKEKTDHVKKHPLHFPQWIMLAPQNVSVSITCA